MLQPKKNRRSSEMDALLEEYEGRAPAPRAGFQPGEHVHGRVVSVGDRVVTGVTRRTAAKTVDKGAADGESASPFMPKMPRPPKRGAGGPPR